MKIRADFVTNSSSSSFTLIITIGVKNRKPISYTTTGGVGEGFEEYYELAAKKSPMELGASESIEELIEALKESVFENGMNEDYIEDEEDPPRRIFTDDSPFIKKIRKIPSMDDITSIEITGKLDGRQGDYLYETYTYDTATAVMTKEEEGKYFCSEGRGGELNFGSFGTRKYIDGRCYTGTENQIKKQYENHLKKYNDYKRSMKSYLSGSFKEYVKKTNGKTQYLSYITTDAKITFDQKNFSVDYAQYSNEMIEEIKNRGGHVFSNYGQRSDYYIMNIAMPRYDYFEKAKQCIADGSKVKIITEYQFWKALFDDGLSIEEPKEEIEPVEKPVANMKQKTAVSSKPEARIQEKKKVITKQIPDDELLSNLIPEETPSPKLQTDSSEKKVTASSLESLILRNSKNDPWFPDERYCDLCGREIEEDETYETLADGEYVCTDCEEKLCARCVNCDVPYRKEELIEEEDGYYCPICNEAYFAKCEVCGKMTLKEKLSQLNLLDTKLRCPQCLKDPPVMNMEADKPQMPENNHEDSQQTAYWDSVEIKVRVFKQETAERIEGIDFSSVGLNATLKRTDKVFSAANNKSMDYILFETGVDHFVDDTDDESAGPFAAMRLIDDALEVDGKAVIICKSFNPENEVNECLVYYHFGDEIRTRDFLNVDTCYYYFNDFLEVLLDLPDERLKRIHDEIYEEEESEDSEEENDMDRILNHGRNHLAYEIAAELSDPAFENEKDKIVEAYDSSEVAALFDEIDALREKCILDYDDLKDGDFTPTIEWEKDGITIFTDLEKNMINEEDYLVDWKLDLLYRIERENEQGEAKTDTLEIKEGTISIDDYEYSQMQISTVILPDGLESIGKYAFSNSAELVSVYIPSTTSIIREGAFSGCSRLQSIVLPERLKMIAKSSFELCESLSCVMIAEGTEVIGERAFHSCPSLEQIIIPDTVREIQKSAFGSCAHLRHIVLSEGLRTIGEEAFKGCEKLKTIVIPDSIETIDANAFQYCSGLEKIVIPEHLYHYTKYIFTNCENIKKILVQKVAYLKNDKENYTGGR